jgi:2-polyprenyl-3-methyl-5-hydroxy-6-metoxy-1,4-benzoquinol methylase
VAQDGGDEWQPVFFTVVTAWDVLEHIKESDLPAVWANVNRHLYPGGYFIVSICTYFEERDLPWHQTIKPWAWWVEQLAGVGLKFDAKATKAMQGQFVRTNSPGVFKKEGRE